jgi:sugar/nucleoside kinase (ribokinase family)
LNIVPVGSVELTENIDPCGCGDMFYAAYSSSIMAGFDMETSIRIANSAARVVARKLFGTGQATPEEIAEEYKVLYPEG